MIREARYDDLQQILELYLHLHERKIPDDNEHLKAVWDKIINDENIIQARTCQSSASVCLICYHIFYKRIRTHIARQIRNYNTSNRRHYFTVFFIYNQMYAKRIAKENDCYKMMLLTSSKKRRTHKFYRCAGYNSIEKTAYIQHL